MAHRNSIMRLNHSGHQRLTHQLLQPHLQLGRQQSCLERLSALPRSVEAAQWPHS